MRRFYSYLHRSFGGTGGTLRPVSSIYRWPLRTSPFPGFSALWGDMLFLGIPCSRRGWESWFQTFAHELKPFGVLVSCYRLPGLLPLYSAWLLSFRVRRALLRPCTA